MKTLLPFVRDRDLFRQELAEFKEFLEANKVFGEQKLLRPFLTARKQLCAQIGEISKELVKPDLLAFEYDLFGDFAVDLVVGDKQEGAYTFVEFEDARPTSLFVQKPTKYKSEFSPRFEHGYSQLVDWFYKLDSMQGSRDIEERFGRREIRYDGLLILGRSEFVSQAEQARLTWRQDRVLVNSKRILVYTFDQLYSILWRKEQASRDILLNE